MSSEQPQTRIHRRKSKQIAALLAALGGCVGAHYFYLGINGTGLIYLLISVFACWIGGPIFIFMLGATDCICLQQMTGAEFDSRFNHRTPKSLEFIFKTRRHVLPQKDAKLPTHPLETEPPTKPSSER